MDDVSQEAETPGMASLKLAIRWAIQEVDDLFAMNMDEMEENEMVARIAHAVLPAIMAAKAEEREACAKVAEKERRTDLAIKHGYKPTWKVVQDEIAELIRSRT